MKWNKELLAEINEKLNSDWGISQCPVCGYNYSHASVRQLSPEETGTRQGGHLILLDGECGHSWGTVYAEHKGQIAEVPVVFQAIPLRRIAENATGVEVIIPETQAEPLCHQDGEGHDQ